MRILLLGGTDEASALAKALAAAGLDAVFSYAGRTAKPIAQPLPTRVGGFGGADGLSMYLREAGITHVVDATHPFAARMSRNAHAACAATGTALVALERPAWTPQSGDVWTRVADMDAAVKALPEAPQRIFLAIGKQSVDQFAARPQHFYLLRMIDAPGAPVLIPDHHVVTGRGPFDMAADHALMTRHGITLLVAKNGGSDSARAKIDAARAMQIPVIMIDRPGVPPRATCPSVAEVMAWLGHDSDRGV